MIERIFILMYFQSKNVNAVKILFLKIFWDFFYFCLVRYSCIPSFNFLWWLELVKKFVCGGAVVVVVFLV